MRPQGLRLGMRITRVKVGMRVVRPQGLRLGMRVAEVEIDIPPKLVLRAL